MDMLSMFHDGAAPVLLPASSFLKIHLPQPTQLSKQGVGRSGRKEPATFAARSASMPLIHYLQLVSNLLSNNKCSGHPEASTQSIHTLARHTSCAHNSMPLINSWGLHMKCFQHFLLSGPAKQWDTPSSQNRSAEITSCLNGTEKRHTRLPE